MADVKWIKIVTDIFDDEKILLIESMPEADSIIVIWFKLLCLAGKNNNSGVFMLNDKIAYTDEMLSTIFRRNINTIRLALKTFESFGMVELIDNVITIPNWSKHQTLDQLEERKEYMRKYMSERRAKQKLIIDSEVNSKVNSKVNVNALEEERDKEEDKEEDKEKEVDTTKVALIPKHLECIVIAWNNLNLSTIKSIQNTRLKLLNARIKDYGIDGVLQAINNIKESSFLKGQNNKNWTITFDWLIKPSNFIKVLEGNYTDKEDGSNARNIKKDNRTSEKPKYDFSCFA